MFNSVQILLCPWRVSFWIQHVHPFPTDEKERFDPTQFQESIVQGLNQTGTDLEAVAKFLDASGAKLDYRRYAETLFDILVAGGMLGELCWSHYSLVRVFNLSAGMFSWVQCWFKEGKTCILKYYALFLLVWQRR